MTVSLAHMYKDFFLRMIELLNIVFLFVIFYHSYHLILINGVEIVYNKKKLPPDYLDNGKGTKKLKQQ